MSKTFRIAIVSDIHYAAAEERAHCANAEFRRRIKNPAVRLGGHVFHHHVWLREHGAHNHLVERFIAAAGEPDLVVANGDYTCDIAQVGVSDDAAFASAKECLDQLRARFDGKFHPILGDHELGKVGLFSGRGAMALASWPRATEGLGIEPFWKVQLGKYVLLGVASSLVALPLFQTDHATEDAAGWEELRKIHLEKIRAAFNNLKPDERLILFCHDPSALPFLWQEETVRDRIAQLEQTVIGHLHSNLFLRGGRMLSGFPTISFFGKGAQRIFAALGKAKSWKPFHVRLCPALAGIELLKDGGWLSAELDADAKTPAHFEFHPIKR